MQNPAASGWVKGFGRLCLIAVADFVSVTRRGSRSLRFDVTIHHVLQLLAGLEEGDFLGGNLDPVAGLGIASDARFALPGTKAAKTANLDLVTGAQRAHHALKDC